MKHRAIDYSRMLKHRAINYNRMLKYRVLNYIIGCRSTVLLTIIGGWSTVSFFLQSVFPYHVVSCNPRSLNCIFLYVGEWLGQTKMTLIIKFEQTCQLWEMCSHSPVGTWRRWMSDQACSHSPFTSLLYYSKVEPPTSFSTGSVKLAGCSGRQFWSSVGRKGER